VKFGLKGLLLLTAIAYMGLWTAGFVWDDVPLIVNNDALRDASLWSIFTTDLWAASGAGDVASGYYRPLVLLSFVLDRWLFDLNPLGYHAHSVLWHGAAVVAFHRLCAPLLDERTALMAAALFALHPVQSEVVAWVAARNDLMAAALGLFALGAVWTGERMTAGRAASAFVLTILAGLSKETALLLPIMLGSADVLRGRTKMLVTRQVPFVAGVCVVIAIRTAVGVGEATIPGQEGLRLLWRGLPALIGGYAASVFSPWPLSSAYDLTWIGERDWSRLGLGWCWVIVLGLCALTGDRERRKLSAIGAVWAIMLVAITLVPTADKGGYGDRFLYWPMAGVALIVAANFGQYIRYVLPTFLVTSLFIVHFRLPDWSHDRALWGAAVRDVPTATNEMSLGHAFTLHERHKRAHVNFVSSLARTGIDLEACGPVVGSAMRTGLPSLALRMGDWALLRGCSPTGPMNGWMAMAAALEGQWERAETWAHSEPSDPRFRDLVVRAALAKRSGNQEAYRALERQWVGSEPLAPQVDALLTR